MYLLPLLSHRYGPFPSTITGPPARVLPVEPPGNTFSAIASSASSSSPTVREYSTSARAVAASPAAALAMVCRAMARSLAVAMATSGTSQVGAGGKKIGWAQT